MKFLNYDGLSYFWSKVKSTFAKKPVIYTATLTVSGWTGTAAPYSQTVTIPEVIAADTGIFDISTATKDLATAEQLQSEGAKIVDITINTGSITARAKEKPTVNLPLFWQIVR